MGKLKSGINGPVSGKVGQVVGSSWNGIEYVRSSPVFTAPRTENQLKNEYIFGVAAKWLKPLKGFFDTGFKGYTRTNFGINAAKSVLYKTALNRDGFNTTVDPTLVEVSFGSLEMASNMQVELTAEKELIFTWDPQVGKEGDSCDQVMMLAYNPVTGDREYSVKGEFRKEGTDFLNLSFLPAGIYHTYAAFVAEDRSRQSMSQYLGSVEL